MYWIYALNIDLIVGVIHTELHKYECLLKSLDG